MDQQRYWREACHIDATLHLTPPHHHRHRRIILSLLLVLALAALPNLAVAAINSKAPAPLPASPSAPVVATSANSTANNISTLLANVILNSTRSTPSGINSTVAGTGSAKKVAAKTSGRNKNSSYKKHLSSGGGGDGDGGNVLHIGGIFPIAGEGGWQGGQACMPAAHLALEDVNNRKDLLPGYVLKLHSNDSECEPGLGASVMYNLLYNQPQKLMLLAGCSTVCTTVAEAAKMWNLVVNLWSCASIIICVVNL